MDPATTTCITPAPNRLIELGKPIDFMEYPNRTHCICEGKGVSYHVFSTLLRYLESNLPAGPANQ